MASTLNSQTPSNPSSTRYFDLLPTELLRDIFKNLEEVPRTKESQKTLLSLCLTSKLCRSHAQPLLLRCIRTQLGAQKDIWYTHKRVCGKENWEWPKPTKTEQKWIEEYAGSTGGPEQDRVTKEMAAKMGPMGEQLVHLLNSVATGTSPISELLNKHSPESQMYNMQSCRRIAFHVRCFNESPVEGEFAPRVLFKHLSKDPFGGLSYFEQRKWEALSKSRPTPYFRNVHHRLLIFFTLLGLSYDDPMEPQHLALIRSSFEEVRLLLEKADESIRVDANSLLVALATLASDCLHSMDKK
ncbi:hypothetical protein JCM3765_003481 [Sporobolomyces pararoseus]